LLLEDDDDIFLGKKISKVYASIEIVALARRNAFTSKLSLLRRLPTQLIEK